MAGRGQRQGLLPSNVRIPRVRQSGQSLSPVSSEHLAVRREFAIAKRQPTTPALKRLEAATNRQCTLADESARHCVSTGWGGRPPPPP